MPRRIALLLTVLTGMTGLVYEVAWQRYLATLFGSHSEATAAVLAIPGRNVGRSCDLRLAFEAPGRARGLPTAQPRGCFARTVSSKRESFVLAFADG